MFYSWKPKLEVSLQNSKGEMKKKEYHAKFTSVKRWTKLLKLQIEQ